MNLEVDFYVRNPECRSKKDLHLDWVDSNFSSREEFIEKTVMTGPNGERLERVFEKNMFPYDTPDDIEHWTLWSWKELTHDEIEEIGTAWLAENMPEVTSWTFDDNEGQKSILIYHIHLFLQFRRRDAAPPQPLPRAAF